MLNLGGVLLAVFGLYLSVFNTKKTVDIYLSVIILLYFSHAFWLSLKLLGAENILQKKTDSKYYIAIEKVERTGVGFIISFIDPNLGAGKLAIAFTKDGTNRYDINFVDCDDLADDADFTNKKLVIHILHAFWANASNVQVSERSRREGVYHPF